MLRRSARLHHGLSGPMPSSLRPSSASPSILMVEPCEDTVSLPSVPDGVSRKRKATREEKKRTDAEKRQRKAQRMPGVGVLRTCSVKAITRTRYEEHFEKYQAWLRSHGLCPTTHGGIDETLALHLEEEYLEGIGYASAQYTLAAVMFYVPALKGAGQGKLALTRQAMKGFRSLAPPQSKLPWPWEVVALMANALVADDLRLEALAILLCFELYLRPGEGTSIRAIDLVPPIPGAKTYQHYNITISPAEAGDPTKIGEYDNTLPLDLPRHALLGPMLEANCEVAFGKGWRRREVALEKKGQISVLRLFPFTAAELTRTVKRVVAKIGADVGDIQLHRLRHAGASHDFLTRTRELEAIRRRGRWMSWKSLRRYEKGPRLSQALQNLDEAWRKHALQCGERVYSVIANKRSALPFPKKPSSKCSAVAAC